MSKLSRRVRAMVETAKPGTWPAQALVLALCDEIESADGHWPNMQEAAEARANATTKVESQAIADGREYVVTGGTRERARMPEHFCVKCHCRWPSGPNVGLHEYCGDCDRAVQREKTVTLIYSSRDDEKRFVSNKHVFLPHQPRCVRCGIKPDEAEFLLCTWVGHPDWRDLK